MAEVKMRAPRSAPGAIDVTRYNHTASRSLAVIHVSLSRHIRTHAWLLVLIAASGWSLLTLKFTNDQFDRISRARQMLSYGEQPFLDFRDPGYFLTLYASAGAQRLSGGSVLGEALVDSAAIGVSVALTFLLAAEVSESVAIGLAAALFALVVSPRAYDYDKVLFYTAGIWAVSRYSERRRLLWLAAAGAIAAVAGLFRYDNGLFLSAAIVAAVVVANWREWPALAKHVVLYGAVVTVILLPVAMRWHATSGVTEVFRQIATYARVEGARTRLFSVSLPRLEGTGLRALATRENLAGLLYSPFLALVPIATFRLVWRWRSREGLSHRVTLVAALVLIALVDVFILRDPVVARIGAAAPLAAVVGAWLIATILPARIERASRHPLALAGMLVIALGAGVVMGGGSPARILHIPHAVTARLLANVREFSRMPPDPAILDGDRALPGMSRYVRACTPAGSRIMATWFMPELSFFSERGFAGGMLVFFGTHWSEPVDQRRTIDQLREQVVPLVIEQRASAAEFASTFGEVNAFLVSTFVPAGATNFGDSGAPADAYAVLIRRDVVASRHDQEFGLPCFPEWTPQTRP